MYTWECDIVLECTSDAKGKFAKEKVHTADDGEGLLNAFGKITDILKKRYDKNQYSMYCVKSITSITLVSK